MQVSLHIVAPAAVRAKLVQAAQLALSRPGLFKVRSSKLEVRSVQRLRKVGFSKCNVGNSRLGVQRSELEAPYLKFETES